jgi:hypothetical protein
MSLGFYLLEVDIVPQWVTPWWSVDFKTCRKDAPIEAVLSKQELTLESKWRRWGALLVRDRGAVARAQHHRSVIVVRSTGVACELPDVAGSLIGSFRTQSDLWHVFHQRAAPAGERERADRSPGSGAPSPAEYGTKERTAKDQGTWPAPEDDDIFGGLS